MVKRKKRRTLMGIRVAVHGGRKFHADECFAVGALMMALGQMQVIRTRDPQVLKSCDFRLDVGGRYDPATGDYDHHQPDCPKRADNIPYASFGLVWRRYGAQICGDQRVADYVDSTLVCSIDAQDNGFSLYQAETVEGVKPFTINDLVRAFNPDTEDMKEKEAMALIDGAFAAVISLCQTFLEAQIEVASMALRDYGLIGEAIAEAEDPRMIIVDKFCPEWQYSVLDQSSSALIMVSKYSDNSGWSICCIPHVTRGSRYRAYLPKHLAGLKDAELEAASGIKGLTFCHKNLFVANASTREAAIALAQLAIAEHETIAKG